MAKKDYKAVFFVDMDGVIAKYDRHAYDRENGPAPGVALFEHEPSRYFAHCDPDPIGIAMMRSLAAIPGTKLYILTSAAPYITWAAEDKKAWLREHCPEIDLERQFVLTRSDKTEVARAMTLADRLDERAVLIDDYNPNLLKWKRAGGTAIKYLNGVNSPESWDGGIYDAIGATGLFGFAPESLAEAMAI